MRRSVLCAALSLSLPAFALTPLQELFVSVTGMSAIFPDGERMRVAPGSVERDDGGELPEGADVPPSAAEELLAGLGRVSDDADGPVSAQFTDSGGRLRRLVHGEEHFSVRAAAGGRVVTDSAEGIAVRLHFDGEDRLTAREQFSLGATSRDLRLLSARSYAYRAGERLPYRMTEEIAEGERLVVTDYDGRGSAIRRETAHYERPDDGEMRLVRDRSVVWEYDGARRLVAEETTDFRYGMTAAGREKVETEVIRRTYDYGGAGGENPDVSYYENGILRRRTAYERVDVYTETTFFDGGLTVRARYKDGAKVQELVLRDGTEIRRRDFAR